MKKKRAIKVRVNRERLESLCRLYGWLLSVYESDDDYEELLRSHVELMYQRLSTLLSRSFQTVLVAFSDPEARAFCTVWQRWNLDHDLPGKVAALELVRQVDRARNRVCLTDQA
jgi:hypothetical protein